MLPPAGRRTVDAGLKWGRRWPISRLQTLWSHRMTPIAGIATSGLRAAAQHSDSMYSTFVHIPGLKVVAPATPADAKGLLKAAIRDPNPVVFLEHEMLYGQEFDVPEVDDYVLPIGKAKVRRVGDGVTITAHSRMVGLALKASSLQRSSHPRQSGRRL